MFALLQLLQALRCYDRREIMRSLLCGCRLLYKSISIYCNGLLSVPLVAYNFMTSLLKILISIPFVSSPGGSVGGSSSFSESKDICLSTAVSVLSVCGQRG
jgi:hypothetical protein